MNKSKLLAPLLLTMVGGGMDRMISSEIKKLPPYKKCALKDCEKDAGKKACCCAEHYKEWMKS